MWTLELGSVLNLSSAASCVAMNQITYYCWTSVYHSVTSPWWLSAKESTCNAEDAAGAVGSIPGLGRSPGEGNGKPTPVFLPGKFHVQRSLAGYSPWVCRVGHYYSNNVRIVTMSPTASGGII